MSQIVIRVERLGKRYRIGGGARHTGLRHLIGDALGAPVRLLYSAMDGSKDGLNDRPRSAPGDGGTIGGTSMRANGRGSRFIWALKDVNFEICQGEVVGLIGRNGAGKSTLLKILARITRPTEGYAEIRGRVGSLLEVGTGFHGELTGRENVYMSGAILGMRKAEINRKFDEIVAFSEVERFLDTPLKHYSSGMQMRLAFAVAAHLEPEILFVDEVLAVGDVAFQKKCLGKMGDISQQGRTIIFVSHNINAIASLCRSAMLLGDGKIVHYSDDVQKVLRLYSSSPVSLATANLRDHPNRTIGSKIAFEEIAIQTEDGEPSHRVLPGANVSIRLTMMPPGRIKNPKISIGVTNFRGERVFALGTHIGGNAISSMEGRSIVRVRFATPPLVPGEYTLDIGLYDGFGNAIDEIYGAGVLEALKDEYISMVDRHLPHMGSIMVRSEWNSRVEADDDSHELTGNVHRDLDSRSPRSNS